MQASDHYCTQCGQAVLGDGSLRGFLDQFLGDYFTFDSKLVRSVLPLLVRPGHLTTEFMAGRRARYIHPLRMFIFLSILFFLVFGWQRNSLAEARLAEELQEEVFWDQFFNAVLPKLFFLFLPLFALLVHGFHRRGGGPVTALVFSMHFHAFIFLVLTVYAVISRLLANWGLVAVNAGLIIALLAYVGWYLWKALRSVYPRTVWKNLFRSVALLMLHTTALVVASLLVVWWLRG